MKVTTEQRYCEHCKKETDHLLREDALEIESTCKECHTQKDTIKTFF